MSIRKRERERRQKGTETSDWQATCSLEAWCPHQWTTRFPAGSGMMGCCRDRDASVQHPCSWIWKLEEFVWRVLLLVHPRLLRASHSASSIKRGWALRFSPPFSLSFEPWHPACKASLRRASRTGDPCRAQSTPRVSSLDHRWFTCAWLSPLLSSTIINLTLFF